MKLEEARDYALSLPDSNEEPHFKANSFRIRGKIFATVPPEDTHIHIFVDEQRRELAIAMYPEFCEKLCWGKKVVGIRVSLSQANCDEVKALLRYSWELKAPKALVDSSKSGKDHSN